MGAAVAQIAELQFLAIFFTVMLLALVLVLAIWMLIRTIGRGLAALRSRKRGQA